MGGNQLWAQSYSELCQKAASLEEKDKLTQAIAQYKKALKIKPEGREALSGLAMSYRGMLYKNPRNKKSQTQYLNTVEKLKDSLELEKALDFVTRKDPKSHYAHFWQGQILLNKGDSAQAYKSLQKAYRLQPKNKQYRDMFLASISGDKQILNNFKLLTKVYSYKKTIVPVKLKYLRGCVLKKRWTYAEKEYTKLYKKNKKLLFGNRDAIDMFFYKKNYHLALNYSKMFLLENPNDLEVRDILIQCFQKKKAGPKVMHREISKYLERDPQSKKWWLELAKLDLKLGNKEKALDHAKIWLERNPDSKQGYQFVFPLVKNDPTQIEYYRDVLAKLIEMDQKNKNQYQMELGFLEYELGRFGEAKMWLSLTAHKHPDNKELWYKLGVSQKKFNQDFEARQSFEKAFALDPQCIECARELVSLMASQEEIKQNLPLLEMLQSQNPDMNQTLKYAKSLWLNGKVSMAGIIWKKLASQDAQFLDLHPEAMLSMIEAGFIKECLPHYPKFKDDAKVNFALAKKLESRGKIKEAIPYYVTAYKLDRQNLDLILSLARLYAKTRDYTKALDGFVRALDIEPTNLNIQAEAVSVAEESQNRFYVKSMYEAILKKDSQSHLAYYGMGKIFLEEKNAEQAIVYLNQAVDLAPDISVYRDLLEDARLAAGDFANSEN